MPASTVSILPFASPVRVSIALTPAPALSHAGECAWATLRAGNPRFFDGPMLSVVSINEASRTVVVQRDRYARLAVQPQVHTGARLLAVTAVCTARDQRGDQHVLLGQRGAGVRMYPGMWELGPSGGLDAPADMNELDEHAILASLAQEVHEEAGLAFTSARCTAVARDNPASSDDLVYHCDCGKLEQWKRARPPQSSAWEYATRAWVPVEQLPAWVKRHGLRTIPTTLATFAHLGWQP